jgi:hypothetical protein
MHGERTKTVSDLAEPRDVGAVHAAADTDYAVVRTPHTSIPYLLELPLESSFSVLVVM